QSALFYAPQQFARHLGPCSLTIGVGNPNSLLRMKR
ncbi:MAG: hypothetical protein ACI9F9_003165, partial [Candidatus Paceibacteria bacterium]